ncbi:MAG: urea carboxylase [Proteobacteria bacterium]|nr:urea carboxylase [Pseudomonadota bacterium]MDA0928017.1 urea carboxylase [Pseudomonadota bacterium]
MSHSVNKVKSVLIANRGAIAVRITRTLKKLGIRAIVVYAEADRESLHVRYADEAYSLGEGSARDTYLSQEKLFTIAREAGADAVHPGYGFLSENTDFVANCEKHGLLFLGPTASQIQAFGLKHRARELAEAQQVPLLPGTGVLKDLNSALSEAEAIGYPVILKSTAGGGGIGMQLCWNAGELSKSYDSVAQLSANNFSNADLFLEKFVENARHIEVQVFGDGEGRVIALGERDCSAQRRNQKVIEETPAPNLADPVRKELHEVACRLLGAVDYRSAGTVEFIYDADTERFYFLEVNTRLQVEHGVTEEIYSVDIVEWMVRLGEHSLPDLAELEQSLAPKGHAVQARIYAEDPFKNFQPCAGLLSYVQFPEPSAGSLRVDHWIESGVEVSPFFDPMLAKIIAIADNREQALAGLGQAIAATSIYGIETNLDYLQQLIVSEPLSSGQYFTKTLAGFEYSKHGIEVLTPGTMTTVQDFPGRTGYWDVGVPPSGPFDSRSFRLGNQLLGNPPTAAGLEMTLNGPCLKFLSATWVVLTGAEMSAELDGKEVPFWTVLKVESGQELKIGKVKEGGARAYLLIKDGIACPDYLGAKATFTLGQFGGHAGRALRTGDVLHLSAGEVAPIQDQKVVPTDLRPAISKRWELHVIPGPQGAPDFFEESYIDTFFNHDWEVHFNSSRTGVRLLGPKPEWARNDGGEAGMHPSNIHDNAYAFGTVDFTGDMPVILGPDGPSLGGFVCPATVVTADLWKVGQLSAGDKVRFVPVSKQSAIEELRIREQEVASLRSETSALLVIDNYAPEITLCRMGEHDVAIRRSGDSWLLIEFGEMVLDIELRFQAHRLMLALNEAAIPGLQELTPGIRSLQVHYDALAISEQQLIGRIAELLEQIAEIEDKPVASRIVHLPLSWDDEQCKLAIERYHQVVRKDAPWYPSNIEFIRRINGLESIDEVKRIVFDANYLVMGLGDVYLGAPVATPMDPRHRLVTTKYNPARTWTAENSVGIGGSYLCIYGMEGPGGYQFVGRTLQMWNRYRQTKEFSKPWLLRFFDQIRFYPVDDQELVRIRQKFPIGTYPIRIEETEFSLAEYKAFLEKYAGEISQFKGRQQKAFDEELANWRRDGQFHFEEKPVEIDTEGETIPEGVSVVESPVAGSVWKLEVDEGTEVEEGDTLLILESMKMEIVVSAPCVGRVVKALKVAGSSVQSGTPLVFIEERP